MKTKTCRTILLLAFCLSLAIAANGITGNALNPTGGGMPEPDKKNNTGANNANANRGGTRNEPTEEDLNLAETIRRRLDESDIKGVRVDVLKRVATLTGKVNNEMVKAEAARIAKDATRKEPRNELTVAPVTSTGNGAPGEGDESNKDQRGVNNNVQTGDGTRARSDAEEGSFLWDFLKWTSIILGMLLAVGLIGYAIWTYVRSKRAQLDGHFNGIRRKQDDLSNKIDASMMTLKKELGERLNSMDEQLRNLSLILKNDHREILEGVRRSSTAPAYAGSAGQPAVQRENVHTFPVSAEEYLGKVKRSGTVVKPDFQNGILVQDPDQRGELLLVQDYESARGGLLYVVPKVGYFQTKQDFFNYYEKYYDCPRPSSGEVWINMPAVVDKVSGGWELREKGELEIK